MKNRTLLKHGMLKDFREYLIRVGWTIETPKGKYEVLRARNPRVLNFPLIVYDRKDKGCGYSIDERALKVYKSWQKDRMKRGLNPYFQEEYELQKSINGTFVNDKDIN